MSAPQIGDTITTAEELVGLPDGAVVVTEPLHHAYQAAYSLPVLREWWRPGDEEPSTVRLPATLVYLPGQPPRPERVVKAEALREAQEAWGGNWGREGRDVMFNALGDNLTPQGRVGKWLETRADRIEQGEL